MDNLQDIINLVEIINNRVDDIQETLNRIDLKISSIEHAIEANKSE